MLETGIDQGEGLRRTTPQPMLRAVAMVSRGEAATEQPLLWQVCTALEEMGHQVAVLDATSIESETNPGLQNLLDHAHWLETDDAALSAWQIVPSRTGLHRLAAKNKETNMPLLPLANLFKNYTVLVVYARADLLSSLFPDSQVRPLLAIAPFRASIVNGYQTLKQLVQQAGLVPTLVSLVTGPRKASELHAKATGASLQNCIHRYLGYQAEVMTVRSFAHQEKPSADAPRLALRLLDSAVGVGYEFSGTLAGAGGATTQPGWSH